MDRPVKKTLGPIRIIEKTHLKKMRSDIGGTGIKLLGPKDF